MKATESARITQYYQKIDMLSGTEHAKVRTKVKKNYEERQRIAGIVAARCGEE